MNDEILTAPVPPLSAVSRRRLSTCDLKLQECVEELAREMEIMVVCGHRNQVEQDAATRTGKSKVPWPKSRHNTFPSEAVDLAPMRDGSIDWNNAGAFVVMARRFMQIARDKGVDIRWGGDWDGDGVTRYEGDKDERFVDLPHFELLKR